MSAILLLLQFCVLAYAVIGGVFLAFSDFLMRSLGRTSGVGGVEAMQVINREVFRWIFMTLFLGMAGISALIAVHAGMNLNAPGHPLILLAALSYLLGCFGVTVLCNVPLNEALARMDLTAPETRAYWKDVYLPRWTFWNSLRTAACGASAALLLFGLLSMVRAQVGA